MLDELRLVSAPVDGPVATAAVAVGNIWGYRAANTAGERVWDAPVPVASVTKSFVSMAAVLASNRGLLDLKTPVGDALEIAGSWAKTTIEDLLAHRARLPAELSPHQWNQTLRMTEAEFLSALSDLMPLPLRGWHYSNLGYGVVAVLIERLTGRSWFELVFEMVLSPLGATRASADPTDEVDLGLEAAAGQLRLPLAELVDFGCLLAGGYPDVAPTTTLDALLAPRALVRRGTAGGLGLFIDIRSGLPRPWTWGLIAGRTTAVLVEPGWGCAVIHGAAELAGDAQSALTEILNGESTSQVRESELAGKWWLDGQEIRVIDYGTSRVLRSPTSAVPLLVSAAPSWDLHLQGDRLFWGKVGMTRSPDDSAWRPGHE